MSGERPGGHPAGGRTGAGPQDAQPRCACCPPSQGRSAVSSPVGPPQARGPLAVINTRPRGHAKGKRINPGRPPKECLGHPLDGQGMPEGPPSRSLGAGNARSSIQVHSSSGGRAGVGGRPGPPPPGGEASRAASRVERPFQGLSKLPRLVGRHHDVAAAKEVTAARECAGKEGVCVRLCGVDVWVWG